MKVKLFHLLKTDCFQTRNLQSFHVFFINRCIAKLMYDTAYLGIICWKRVCCCLGTSDGSILSVCQSDEFGFLTFILLIWRIWWDPTNACIWQMGFNLAFKGLIELSSCGRRRLHRGSWSQKTKFCWSSWSGK